MVFLWKSFSPDAEQIMAMLEVVSAYFGLQESNIPSQSLSAICPGICKFEVVSGQS